VFTARYGLMPYIKQIAFRLLKVKAYSVEESLLIFNVGYIEVNA
jgi:hypothetical protein